MFRNKYSVSLNEVGVVPESPITYSDDDIDLSVKIGKISLGSPIISAAMDSVSSTDILLSLVKAGGMGTLNLCGLISRYPVDSMGDVYKQIIDKPEVTTLQKIYNENPIDIRILSANLERLKDILCLSDGKIGVSATPQRAVELFRVIEWFGIRTVLIQSSFISPYWQSQKYEGIDILKFTQELHDRGCTVIVGNVASLDVAIPFISAGVDAIVLGIGPGQQCTTRFALGIGAGHISSIADVREYIEKHRSQTRLIADGGIHNSGDIIKLLCSGAHAVILGGMFARTTDAPYCGFHWGMSSFHSVLPRGDLLKFDVEEGATVARLLHGPSTRADGTMALLPALTNALSNLGCLNISDAYFKTSVVQFPSIAKEGKFK